MLAPLDNETFFKKAFTDKIVFEQFIEDIFGVKVNVDKIETEKKYEPKAGYIDLTLDIYAETTDKRFIIEIQRIDYDYNFDRFLYYFLQTITQQQKNAKNYTIKQDVLAVVILTHPYKINKETKQAVQDNVLKLDFDLKNLKDEVIKMWGHNLVFLNPHPKYKDPKTPARYEDWFNLIRQSVQQNKKYTLNLNNVGIAKAVDLIDYENLSPEEIRQGKITEGRKIVKKMDLEEINELKEELQQNKQELQENKEELQQQAELIEKLEAQLKTKK